MRRIILDMKILKYIIVLLTGIFFLGSCGMDNTDTWREGTGIVEKDSEIPSACETLIRFADGSTIIPIEIPEGTELVEGQEVWIKYVIVPIEDRFCSNGVNCQVLEIEDITCVSYVDINFSNYDSLSYDPVIVNEMYVDGDCLYLDLSYSGGCAEHIVDIALSHPWCGTPPLPPPMFEIRHNANDDLCEALLRKQYRFDISGIRKDDADSVVFDVWWKAINNEVKSESLIYRY